MSKLNEIPDNALKRMIFDARNRYKNSMQNNSDADVIKEQKMNLRRYQHEAVRRWELYVCGSQERCI